MARADRAPVKNAPRAEPDRLRRFAPVLLALCAIAAYANTFAVPFLFDDLQSIVESPNLHAPWAFVTDAGNVDSTLSGRPVAALTVALQVAAGGLDVVAFHALNLAIHVAAGWLLFGLVRRTLELPRLRERFTSSATAVALVVALLWLVHPLQTKAVTYIVQRVESLAAMLVLASLYAFLRGAQARSSRWFAASVAASALAMGTKETAAALPVLVLLYDRAFLAGSLRQALRERGKWHVALAATWLVLIALIATSPRIRVAGEAAASVAPLDYARTQCAAIGRYVGLAVWPRELVFDYGMAGDGVPLATRVSQWLPWAAPLLAVIALVVAGVARNRAWSFAAAAFFLVLAPSSSFVPIAQDVIAEHRMYLPLAALAVLAVCGLASAVRNARVVLLAGAVLAAALGARTIARNRDYGSDVSIWSDTVEKRPGSARAQTNLGLALEVRGDLPGAEARHRAAVAARPDYSEARHNLAAVLMKQQRFAEAESEFRRALDASPGAHQTHLGLAEALVQQNELDEAGEHFERALAGRSDLAGAHKRLGGIRETQGRLDEAAAHYGATLALDPQQPEVRNRFGIVLAQQGKLDAAAEQFRRALAQQPSFTDARANLDRVLALQKSAPPPR